MNKKRTIFSLVILTVIGVTMNAAAQERGKDKDRNRNHREQRNHRDDDRHDHDREYSHHDTATTIKEVTIIMTTTAGATCAYITTTVIAAIDL
jgi:Ni/Co efflux regulator RcnB